MLARGVRFRMSWISFTLYLGSRWHSRRICIANAESTPEFNTYINEAKWLLEDYVPLIRPAPLSELEGLATVGLVRDSKNIIHWPTCAMRCAGEPTTHYVPNNDNVQFEGFASTVRLMHETRGNSPKDTGWDFENEVPRRTLCAGVVPIVNIISHIVETACLTRTGSGILQSVANRCINPTINDLTEDLAETDSPNESNFEHYETLVNEKIHCVCQLGMYEETDQNTIPLHLNLNIMKYEYAALSVTFINGNPPYDRYWSPDIPCTDKHRKTMFGPRVLLGPKEFPTFVHNTGRMIGDNSLDYCVDTVGKPYINRFPMQWTEGIMSDRRVRPSVPLRRTQMGEDSKLSRSAFPWKFGDWDSGMYATSGTIYVDSPDAPAPNTFAVPLLTRCDCAVLAYPVVVTEGGGSGGQVAVAGRYGPRCEKICLAPSDTGAVCSSGRGDDGSARGAGGPVRCAMDPRATTGYGMHLDPVARVPVGENIFLIDVYTYLGSNGGVANNKFRGRISAFRLNTPSSVSYGRLAFAESGSSPGPSPGFALERCVADAVVDSVVLQALLLHPPTAPSTSWRRVGDTSPARDPLSKGVLAQAYHPYPGAWEKGVDAPFPLTCVFSHNARVNTEPSLDPQMWVSLETGETDMYTHFRAGSQSAGSYNGGLSTTSKDMAVLRYKQLQIFGSCTALQDDDAEKLRDIKSDKCISIDGTESIYQALPGYPLAVSPGFFIPSCTCANGWADDPRLPAVFDPAPTTALFSSRALALVKWIQNTTQNIGFSAHNESRSWARPVSAQKSVPLRMCAFPLWQTPQQGNCHFVPLYSSETARPNNSCGSSPLTGTESRQGTCCGGRGVCEVQNRGLPSGHWGCTCNAGYASDPRSSECKHTCTFQCSEGAQCTLCQFDENRVGKSADEASFGIGYAGTGLINDKKVRCFPSRGVPGAPGVFLGCGELPVEGDDEAELQGPSFAYAKEIDPGCDLNVGSGKAMLRCILDPASVGWAHNGITETTALYICTATPPFALLADSNSGWTSSSPFPPGYNHSARENVWGIARSGFTVVGVQLYTTPEPGGGSTELLPETLRCQNLWHAAERHLHATDPPNPEPTSANVLTKRGGYCPPPMLMHRGADAHYGCKHPGTPNTNPFDFLVAQFQTHLSSVFCHRISEGPTHEDSSDPNSVGSYKNYRCENTNQYIVASSDGGPTPDLDLQECYIHLIGTLYTFPEGTQWTGTLWYPDSVLTGAFTPEQVARQIAACCTDSSSTAVPDLSMGCGEVALNV
jgi:hypothetical protein